MKLFLAIVLLASPMLATNYTVTTNANQDAVLERSRVDYNGGECSRLGLPTNCTLAQAQSKDAGTTYANTITAYLILSVKNQVFSQKEQQTATDAVSFCQAWKALSGAQQNTACAQIGLAAGCTPCP